MKTLDAWIAAGRALLACILGDPDGFFGAFECARKSVDHQSFVHPAHGRLFAAMERVHGRSGLVALASLAHEVAGDPDLVELLDNLGAEALDPGAAGRYAMLVRDAHIARMIESDCTAAVEATQRGDRAEAMRHLDRARRDVAPDGPADLASAPWRSPSDLFDAARDRAREWLLPRVLSYGSVVFLIGDPKVPGKTTFSLAVAANALRGCDLFGKALPGGPSGVVLLTEEADIDLAEKLVALGVARDANFTILTRSLMNPRPSWEEAARLAVAKCEERGARLLIIDTFYRWAAFDGEDANRSAAVLRALDHLADARRAGIVTLLPHHAAKGASANGREGGAAGLGSISGPGEAEVNIEIRNTRDKAHPNRRTLKVESRASGVLELVIELVRGAPTLGTPDHYEEIGDATEIRQLEVDARITDFVLAHPGQTGRYVATHCGVRAGDVERRLPRLVDAGRLSRRGRGRSRSPYRYWLPGCAPAGVSDISLPTPSDGDPGRAAPVDSVSPPSPPSGRRRSGRSRRPAHDRSSQSPRLDPTGGSGGAQPPRTGLGSAESVA